MDLFAQLFVNGLINGSHYALLGAGFGLIFATTRIVHFAYGPIFTAAAYAAWFAANVLGLPIAAAMLFAALVAAALGTATYQYLYLPFELRQSSSHVALIASLGLFIVLENLIAIVFGTGGRVVDSYQYGIFLIGPAYFSSVQLGQMIAMIVLTASLGVYLARTRHGKAILATTDNPEMARIIGIDTVKVSRLVFAIGSALSAIPATLILLKDGATPSMGFFAVFIAFVAVIVGGVGSLRGAVAGGLALGMVESLGLWKIPTEWQSSIVFIVLFLVVLLRPQGLFGRAVS
jgi:branched-chain amino acid transport system permease protein